MSRLVRSHDHSFCLRPGYLTALCCTEESQEVMRCCVCIDMLKNLLRHKVGFGCSFPQLLSVECYTHPMPDVTVNKTIHWVLLVHRIFALLSSSSSTGGLIRPSLHVRLAMVPTGTQNAALSTFGVCCPTTSCTATAYILPNAGSES